MNPILASYIPAVPAVPVKPSLAFACLKSVPLHKDNALAQLKHLRPLFEWQSTIEYNKKPPRGYLSEGVDLIQGFDDIAEKLNANRPVYTNQYEFLVDLDTLQGRVRDLHFSAVSLLLDLFTTRGVDFVSISEDGWAPPKIFVHDKDNYRLPSEVLTIDGIPASEFLQKLSVQDWWSHDPDARYNSLFPSLAKDASPLHPPGNEFFTAELKDTTTVTWRNGTTFTFHNTAFIRANLTNITSGADLYRDFGLASGKGPTPHPWFTYKASELGYAANYTRIAGFPIPINSTLGGDTAGFLSQEPALRHTAVLAVNSFASTLDINNLTNSLTLVDEVNRVSVDFIRTAKAAGRTRLILDVQGNNGGSLNNLAMLYFNLFPGTTLPIQSQARIHPQLAWLVANSPLPTNTTTPAPLPWLFRTYHQSNNLPFPPPFNTSFLSPVTTPFGNYTPPMAWDPISAYFPPALLNYTLPWTDPPFAPENITILTDGLCASACAMFVGMLTHSHGIRTVAIGGRPIHKPMQAVGRTRGGPAVTFGSFPRINRTTAVPVPGLNPDDIVPTSSPPLRLRNPPTAITPNEGVRFNLANMNVLGADLGEVPWQFRYEAANCKVFYTWEMTRSIEAVWKKVMEVAWEGGRCVEGSTTGAKGRIGGVKGFEEGVEDGYFGAGGGGPGEV